MIDPDSPLAQEPIDKTFKFSQEYEDLGEALARKDPSPVVTAVNKILYKALLDKANEIRLDPELDALKVNFYKDGMLTLAYPTLPGKVIPSLTSRIKMLANLNNANRRIPQCGRILRCLNGENFDFLVSTLPTTHGEKITLKIVQQSALTGLDELIPQPQAVQSIRSMLGVSKGLILITGPVKAGKSTTLFSMLREKSQSAAKVTTLENPIEYHLPDMTQIQVNPSTSIGFPEALEAALLEPVDVLALSEIQNRETAIAALNAAQSKLVLATITTDNSTSALTLLREFAIPDTSLASTIVGIVHQRLLRQVCADCRQPHTLSDEDQQRYGLSGGRFANLSCYEATVINHAETQSHQTTNQICSTCGGTGYKGQTVVCEVLNITQPIKALIEQGLSAQKVYETAVLQLGMTAIWANSLDLVAQGRTTLAEIDRIVLNAELLRLEQQLAAITGETPAATKVSELTDEINEFDTFTESDVSHQADHPLEPTEIHLPLDGKDPFAQPSHQEPSQTADSASLNLPTSSEDDDLNVDPTMDLESFHLSGEAEAEIMTVEPKVTSLSQEGDAEDFLPTVNLDDFELPEEFNTAIFARPTQPIEGKQPVAPPQLDEEIAEELEIARQQLRESATARSQLQQKVEQQTKELTTIQQKVEQLQQQNEGLTKNLKEERAQLKEQLVQERKELNRQFDRQKAEAFRKAKKDVVLPMLEAVDSFEQANARLSEEERSSPLHKGYQAIYRLLLVNLKKVGVVAVESIKQPFDPNVHEAVMMEESYQYTCDTVVEEFRRGYLLDEVILRPAQVKVAVAQEAPPQVIESVAQPVVSQIKAEDAIASVDTEPATELSDTPVDLSNEDWLSSALGETVDNSELSTPETPSPSTLMPEIDDLDLELPMGELTDGGTSDLDQMLADLGFDEAQ